MQNLRKYKSVNLSTEIVKITVFDIIYLKIMTIERLHFEEGYPFTFNESTADGEVAKLLEANRAEIQTLPEGFYDLTPKLWIENPARYGLVVLGNGNGIYSENLHGNDAETKGLDQQGQSQRKTEGNITRLPQDLIVLIFCGLLQDKKSMGIYDIIRHVQGTSPENESETKNKERIPAGVI